jgi:hypothetical protein
MIAISTIRDFRIPGAPLGYLAVQSDHYYAAWQIHEPDTLMVRAPSGEGLDWLTLRVGAGLQCAGQSGSATTPLLHPHNLKTIVENWGGGGTSRENLTLIFAADDAEGLRCEVLFTADKIECVYHQRLEQPMRVRHFTWGCTADGRGTLIGGDRVFNAGPQSHGLYEHDWRRPQFIRPDWFTPPPYCYAFGLSDGTWMAAALESPVGAMPYRLFSTGAAGDGIRFEVDYDSEPRFEALFSSPPLVFRFGAADALGAIRLHAEGLRADGRSPVVKRESQDWWRGVMVCGWHRQMELQAQEKRKDDCCTQAVYEALVAELEAKSIDFSLLTIDMFWGNDHGLWQVDPAKWPDLRGFIDRQHARGRRVLLWVCTNTHGLPDDELLLVGDRRMLDPLNPAWLRRLRSAFETMFGDGEGQLNADGIKFDFTDLTPVAGEQHGTREIHGLDYLHALFSAVYQTAKAVRPDVLMDFQLAHPAFASINDMTRLNDYFLPAGQAVRVMETRAGIAHAAGAGILVDVDGPASEAYFEQSGRFGNISLYIDLKTLGDPAMVNAIQRGIKAFNLK